MFDTVATWLKSWFSNGPLIPKGADLASDHWDDVPLRRAVPLLQADAPTPPPRMVLRAPPRPAAAGAPAGQDAEAAEWQALLARAKSAEAEKTPAPIKVAALIKTAPPPPPPARPESDEDWEAVIARARRATAAGKSPNEKLQALIRNVRLDAAADPPGRRAARGGALVVRPYD